MFKTLVYTHNINGDMMNKTASYLSNLYKNNDDFILREINNGKNNIYVVYFESLCDSKGIYDYVIRNIFNYKNKYNTIDKLIDVVSSPKLITLKSDKEIFYYIENGFCVVFYKKEMYAIEVKADIDRGITLSQTEPNLYGPKDSFCENYQKNLGTIKRRIKTKDLKVDSAIKGDYTKDKVSLLYLESKVNKVSLNKIKTAFNKLDLEVIDSNKIIDSMDKDPIFPTIMRTEKPSLVSEYILKGKIVMIIDNTPFALLMDTKLSEFINPTVNDKFIKILRYLCFILTIITPGVYVALTNFNPEAIPTSLLINFSYQRYGVPFPAIIEALIMLLVCEILRETDLRFPNSYGSAASILGALILGDASVSAGIVSPIMIIVIAITFITNLLFTQIKLIWALRILRIMFLIIGTFFGLYGIALASIFTLAYISNVNTLEGTYI